MVYKYILFVFVIMFISSCTKYPSNGIVIDKFYVPGSSGVGVGVGIGSSGKAGPVVGSTYSSEKYIVVYKKTDNEPDTAEFGKIKVDEQTFFKIMIGNAIHITERHWYGDDFIFEEAK